MNKYKFDLTKCLELQDYIFQVEANSEEEAKEKLSKIGFNAGKRLSSSWRGDFSKAEVLK